MDFMWAPDIPNARKQNSYLPSHNNHQSETSPEDHIVQSRLPYTPPSNTASNGPHPSSRRSRADTMPSSMLPPFLGSNTIYNTQQRPNLDRSPLTTNQDHYASGMSSPLDENASNSIASTLASLGLNDLTDTNTESRYFEPTRNRSMTSREQNMAFSPFVSTRQNRPRAVSLGMVDLPLPSSAFDPFDSSFNNQSIEYQRNTNSGLTDVNNHASLFQSRNLFTRMDSHEEEDNKYMENTVQSSDDGMEPPAQTPSRALWLGNINPSLSVPDLHKMFVRYGNVESARILSDKECAFVNFETVESALAAKEDLVNRLGCMISGSIVKVGFGKADVNLAMALTNEAGPNAQGPTRALWVGNIPANINPAVLRSLFQSFGVIESIRILSHKNCGFVNFERQEDAVRARKVLQNKELLGLGSGVVRIGFAKAPTNNPDEVIQDVVISGNTITSYPAPPLRSQQSAPPVQQENTTQWATAMLMASMLMNASAASKKDDTSSPQSSNNCSPSVSTTLSHHQRLASERKLIMQQLGYSTKMDKERNPITYFSVIPSVPEFGTDRILGPLRLREIRKMLENGQALPGIEYIAQECMPEIVELCSDYIGNTVVQKLFEFCSEETKLNMIERIAPYLASIGIHKNGTWAAQKIIDTATTDQQIGLICTNIAPYVPLLLLDQFGNYVVQGCLGMGPAKNQYIFDAIVDKCWEIGQGRFGARAVRAILENPIVTKDQQIYVASAIMQNALLLTTNANGSILLNWLLDISGLLGNFRTMCNLNN
ncbi:hypothetical protein HPULCUR_000877 [Helicostylum pulchrum]|uniref:Uncharacterized protein n=1 Tax=Helicostylum pulchrum TaxID=562976 RepID=A0ABP9XL36_9FUNG